MSGIVAILNLDVTPVDPGLLGEMTQAMARRGPDARRTWIVGGATAGGASVGGASVGGASVGDATVGGATAGPLGFGHALLRTTEEAGGFPLPGSLDGEVWITADARVDARIDLRRGLEGLGQFPRRGACDAELILHAYLAWGEACVEHLMGDFAFALWDGREERLFCARDHFGVKPFYYAYTGDCLVLANTLNCLRRHPAVSAELDDLAVADLLLFDSYQDPAATAFAHIRRLPPAHTLTWSRHGLRVGPFWKVPTDGEVRYRRSQDYVEHFTDLLHSAVEDRLRSRRVAVWMTGGLDSTTVTAASLARLRQSSSPFDLRAYTTVYDRLIPDRERFYSGLVARALGIPIHYLAADDFRPYQGWDGPELCTPEPDNSPLAVIDLEQYRQILPHSRIVLSGYGGDPALCASGSHLVDLWRRRRLGRLTADAGRYLWCHGRLPPFGVRTRLRRWLGRPDQAPAPYPTWLNPDLAARFDLEERWRRGSRPAASTHPLRPEAHSQLSSHLWAEAFESYDPGVTGFPVEARHPFFDLRLVNYLLALPSTPCCIDKGLLRKAMRGMLPKAVLARPKTPLAGDPVVEFLRQHGLRGLEPLDPVPELERYVVTRQVPPISGDQGDSEIWVNLRPLSLNYWLRHHGQA